MQDRELLSEGWGCCFPAAVFELRDAYSLNISGGIDSVSRGQELAIKIRGLNGLFVYLYNSPKMVYETEKYKLFLSEENK